VKIEIVFLSRQRRFLDPQLKKELPFLKPHIEFRQLIFQYFDDHVNNAESMEECISVVKFLTRKFDELSNHQ
jgi:hypothetical protein